MNMSARMNRGRLREDASARILFASYCETSAKFRLLCYAQLFDLRLRPRTPSGDAKR